MTHDPVAGGVPVAVLLDYLYWLRDRVIAGAAALPADRFLATPTLHGRDLRATLAHEIDVEMSWSGRLRGRPLAEWGPDAELKPESFNDVAGVERRWHDEERTFRAWLDGLSAGDRAAPTTINGLDGRSIDTYLLHVITHGLLELGGAAGLLHEMGQPLGDIGLTTALAELESGGGPGSPVDAAG